MTGAASFPSFIARRFALLLLTMVLVPSLSFVMFTLIQGEQTAPLDLLGALGSYLSATFLHADLGSEHFHYDTFIRTRSAFEVVSSGLAVDVYLLGGALLFGVLGGLLAGALQATHPRSIVSRASAVVTVLALSSPVYWLGLVVLLLFAPGVGSVVQIPFLSTVGSYRAPSQDPIAFVRAAWMPCLIVALPLAAACTRMCASQLLGTLSEDFVRTARGNGVGSHRVVWRHALPAAAGPVVALVGVNMNLILTNLALVESVFNLPGGFRYIERALITATSTSSRRSCSRRRFHRGRELPRRRGPRVARSARAHGRADLTASIAPPVRCRSRASGRGWRRRSQAAAACSAEPSCFVVAIRPQGRTAADATH